MIKTKEVSATSGKYLYFFSPNNKVAYKYYYDYTKVGRWIFNPYCCLPTSILKSKEVISILIHTEFIDKNGDRKSELKVGVITSYYSPPKKAFIWFCSFVEL